MLEGKKFIYNPKFVFVVPVTTIRFVNSSYFFPMINTIYK